MSQKLLIGENLQLLAFCRLLYRSIAIDSFVNIITVLIPATTHTRCSWSWKGYYRRII